MGADCHLDHNHPKELYSDLVIVLSAFSPPLHPNKTASNLERIINQKPRLTRDIEIKNIVTIARGSGEGIVGRGVYRSYYKGHKDEIKGE